METVALPNSANPLETQAKEIYSSIAERLEIVARAPIFDGLSKADQIQVALCGSRRFFARKQRLCGEVEAAESLFVLESGCIKLEKLRPSGSTVILWIRGAGDSVGPLALPRPEDFTSSVRVVVEGTAIEWDWTALNRLRASQKIQQNVSQILAREVKELEERFCEIATGNVAHRVANCLARLLHQVGKVSHEGMEVHLTRQEIAACTGTTQFAVSRLMSLWEANGFIVSARSTVLVRYPDRLMEMARFADAN